MPNVVCVCVCVCVRACVCVWVWVWVRVHVCVHAAHDAPMIRQITPWRRRCDVLCKLSKEVPSRQLKVFRVVAGWCRDWHHVVCVGREANAIRECHDVVVCVSNQLVLVILHPRKELRHPIFDKGRDGRVEFCNGPSCDSRVAFVVLFA
jgi:hypothetical protein